VARIKADYIKSTGTNMQRNMSGP